MKKKKVTKDEWFAAASAQDYWAVAKENTLQTGSDYLFTFEACEQTGAKQYPYNNLYWEAKNEFEEIDSLVNEAFLAAQIGCEKAGLT